MNIDAHIPTEPLRPFIKTYLIIENQDELVNRVLHKQTFDKMKSVHTD